jgi:Family of unknown function (DUF5681)
MAARKSPSKGGKPDKLMRDALLLELNQEAKLADGKVTKRRRVVARKLVERAEQGDVPAIKEIFDRVDGRVPQSIYRVRKTPRSMSSTDFCKRLTAQRADYRTI